jgi:GntR family transcriptional regulator
VQASVPDLSITTKPEGTQPAYRRIQRAIQDTIEKRHLKPGDALASERELARTHGVSLMTARNALTGLERQGLVERRRGAGTYVAVPKIDFNKLLSTTELMAGRGISVHSRVLSVKVLNDQPEIAAKLGLRDDSALLKMERLRQVQHEPLALEACYLAADKHPELAREPLEAGSLFMTLEHKYKVQIAYSDEEVDATASDSRVARLLDIEAGTPVLRIRQIIYSTPGDPVMYVYGLYRSDRHKLHVRRLRY